MSQDSHGVLEECSNRAKQLVVEIEKFQEATAIQEGVARNLAAVAGEIKKVADQVKPLQAKTIRRFQVTTMTLCVGNALLTAVVLVLLLIRLR